MIVLAAKSGKKVRVRAHLKKKTGRPVRAYLRDARLAHGKPFTAAERATVKAVFPQMLSWAWASVGSRIAQGVPVMFPSDAAQDAAIEGLLTYLSMARGPGWERRVRQRIAGAVRDHLVWERTHGITGSSWLDRTWAQAEGAEKDRLGALQVMVTRDLLRFETFGGPSAEEALVHGAEVRDREDVLRVLAERWGIDLAKVAELAGKRRAARGHAQADVVRDLKIFEDRVRGENWTQLGKRYGVSPRACREGYERIVRAIRAVEQAERRESHERRALQAWEQRTFGKALQLRDIAQDRLQRAFVRHLRALNLGIAGSFLDENRSLLSDLLLDAR